MLKSCAVTSEEITMVSWWGECTAFHFVWRPHPRGMSCFRFWMRAVRHYVHYHANFIDLINFVSFTNWSLSQPKRIVQQLWGTFEKCLCGSGLTALTELQLFGNETVLHSHSLVLLMARLCSFKLQRTIETTDKVLSIPVTSLFQIIVSFMTTRNYPLEALIWSDNRLCRISILFPYIVSFMSLWCSCKFNKICCTLPVSPLRGVAPLSNSWWDIAIFLVMCDMIGKSYTWYAGYSGSKIDFPWSSWEMLFLLWCLQNFNPCLGGLCISQAQRYYLAFTHWQGWLR